MFLRKKRFPLQFYLKKESPVIFTYSASSAVSVVSTFSSAVSSALSASLLSASSASSVSVSSASELSSKGITAPSYFSLIKSLSHQISIHLQVPESFRCLHCLLLLRLRNHHSERWCRVKCNC